MADRLDTLHAALSDRYVIDRELGRGGMSTVYLARDLKHALRGGANLAQETVRTDRGRDFGAKHFDRHEARAAFALPVEPDFDSPRSEPSFARVLNKVGLRG